jgi:hypothetical protein
MGSAGMVMRPVHGVCIPVGTLASSSIGGIAPQYMGAVQESYNHAG